MAAKRDRSGLTAKETKIVSKKSRLFDSNTQGIGLPQKSAKRDRSGKPITGSAMRGKKNSKGLKATQFQGIEKLTTGRAKAIVRNVKVKEFGVNITKGKNKNWAKEANKTTLPSAATSRRASVKESNFNSRMAKHPLVRNAGEQASEKKYRENRGKPVPVKPKNKKPNTVASGAAFGKKPSRSRGGLRGGGMLGGGGGMSRTNR